MDVKDSPGFYLKPKSEVVLNKERMKQLNYKRPDNFKEYDDDPISVFIWGDETPDELVEKIIKQESQHRSGVGLVISSIFNFKNDMEKVDIAGAIEAIESNKRIIDATPSQTLVDCLTLLKQKDINTYNSFKKGKIFERLGLDKKSTGQGCLVLFILPPLLYILTLIS